MWNDPELAYRLLTQDIDQRHADAARRRLRGPVTIRLRLGGGRWLRLLFARQVRLRAATETDECQA
jgi:hypothetical protein